MMNNQSLLPILLIPSFLVLIPAAAMLLEAEGWAWSTSDFVIVWVGLAAAVATYKFASSRAPNRTYRVATGLAVTAGMVLLWINGAVGLIGSEDNPANLLYGAVLVVGLIGAALARGRPAGMARALFVTAAAQFLVPVVALVLWRSDFSPGVVPVFGLNFGFVLLFATSGILFRQAATPSSGADMPTPA